MNPPRSPSGHASSTSLWAKSTAFQHRSVCCLYPSTWAAAHSLLPSWRQLLLVGHGFCAAALIKCELRFALTVQYQWRWTAARLTATLYSLFTAQRCCLDQTRLWWRELFPDWLNRLSIIKLLIWLVERSLRRLNQLYGKQRRERSRKHRRTGLFGSFVVDYQVGVLQWIH